MTPMRVLKARPTSNKEYEFRAEEYDKFLTMHVSEEVENDLIRMVDGPVVDFLQELLQEIVDEEFEIKNKAS